MTNYGNFAQLGPIMQMAFLPNDFDAALNYWTKTMGVGPFFLMENIQLEDMRYLGEATDCCFTIAIAYWGDMQIEIIRAENDSPGIYTGKYAQNGDILHHCCIMTDDIEKAKTIAKNAGSKILIEAKVGDDGAVIYVDSGNGAGSIVEILQPASGSDALFDMMKQAAVNWDGLEAIRSLG